MHRIQTARVKQDIVLYVRGDSFKNIQVSNGKLRLDRLKVRNLTDHKDPVASYAIFVA